MISPIQIFDSIFELPDDGNLNLDLFDLILPAEAACDVDCENFDEHVNLSDELRVNWVQEGF